MLVKKRLRNTVIVFCLFFLICAFLSIDISKTTPIGISFYITFYIFLFLITHKQKTGAQCKCLDSKVRILLYEKSKLLFLETCPNYKSVRSTICKNSVLYNFIETSMLPNYRTSYTAQHEMKILKEEYLMEPDLIVIRMTCNSQD